MVFDGLSRHCLHGLDAERLVAERQELDEIAAGAGADVQHA